jgi:hypothetical protein
MRWRLTLVALLGLGCNGNPTQVLLTVRLDASQGLDQIQIAAQSSSRTFPTVRRPDPAAGALADPQSVAILLPDDSAGQRLTFTVEGLRQGAVIVVSTTVAVPLKGTSVVAEVWLGRRPSDARIDARGDARVDSRSDLVIGKDSTPDRADSTIPCVDADKDGVTPCAGDCDDADPNAYPGQTGFFSSPTKGKSNYDYNCDTIEEMEGAQLVNCVRVGTDCQGDGWQGSIPGCGVQGVFIQCRASGQTSCSHDQSQKIQGCR